MQDDEEEIWAPINGFPEYAVSSLGRVQHVAHREVVRKSAVNHQGFPTLVLYKNSTRYVRQVNKLVAEAFCENPEYSDMTAIWHIDGDFLNCKASNLMWERRDRVLEWNEMHRSGKPKYNTPKVQLNRTGEIFHDAYELAMHEGVLESSVIAHIERYPEEYADRARYRYV